jgi:hypothetical protein
MKSNDKKDKIGKNKLFVGVETKFSIYLEFK